jgi:predicted ATPase with chaperone activity
VDALDLLRTAASRHALSVGRARVLRVARTIADLARSATIAGTARSLRTGRA